MLGIPGCAFGFKGICKNSTTQINVYKFLLSAFSVPAVIWGIIASLWREKNREREKSSSKRLQIIENTESNLKKH